jgi:hypothetical protein
LSGGLSIGALGRESELGQRVGRILRGGAGMKAGHARLVLGGAMLGVVVGAVELARCPQVVAFSSSSSKVARSVEPAQAMKGVGYEAVVFHPGVNPTHRGEAAMNGARSDMGVERQTTLRDDAAKDGPPSVVAIRRTARSRRPVVVLSAWDGGDGSRVVLTAARVVDGVPQGLRLVRVVDQAPEFRRYAAVPTQDGWLVIQL